jgi:hypothetical protein
VSLLLSSFWRAAAYCLLPRVILLSLLPLLILGALALGLGYFFWEGATGAVLHWLEASASFATMGHWLQSIGLGNLRTAVAPLIVIFAITPAAVVLVMLCVALLMMPAIVNLVADRRFDALERRHGSSWVVGVLWSLGSTLLAAIALVLSIPLWLVPPLILVLPPLIWGWLTYRVMAYDALADHASREERREVFRRHRFQLLTIGVVTGYLGAAPSIVWASGWFFAAAFVFLVPVAIWIYTLVFAFSCLWFAHYGLAALQALRAGEPVELPLS